MWQALAKRHPNAECLQRNEYDLLKYSAVAYTLNKV
jgi:hypothetical protein